MTNLQEQAAHRPPTMCDLLGALELAREHFIYAPDNVWQGTGDLDRLASTVRDATVWYFWWD